MNGASLYKSPEGYREVMAFYDQALARWPVPYEELRLATQQGETFAIACGERQAPPVVLLHGTCSNAVAWLGDVKDLCRHFRVYAVDVIGEPGRSAPSRPPFSGHAYAEWLEDVLAGLGVARASLVGISQGGWMALSLATRHPECVERLVLLAPGGVAQVRMSFLLRAIPLSFLGRWGGEVISRITMGEQPVHPDAVAYMNAIMTHFRPRIGAPRLFTGEELKRLTMPVLLVVGARDALFPSAKTVARLETLLPQLVARILPDVGHMLHGMAGEMVPFLRGEGL